MFEKIKELLHIKSEIDEEEAEKVVYTKSDIEEMFVSLVKETYTLEFQCGSDIVEYDCEITRAISDLRNKIKDETGFIMPAIQGKEVEELQENEYKIFVAGKEVFNDFLIPNKKTVIEEISKQLENCCKTHIGEVFTNEIMENYIQAAWNRNPWMMDRLVHFYTTTNLKSIFVQLLENGKSIKNVCFVFEKILEVSKIEEFPCYEKDIDKIARKVSRMI